MSSSGNRFFLVAPRFQSPVPGAILQIAKMHLPAEQLALRAIGGAPHEQKAHLEEILTQPGICALIGIDVCPPPSVLFAYKSAGVAVLLIDEEAEGVSTVSADNFEGGRIAGEHLVARGRKRIAVVSGRTQAAGGYNAEQRVNGLRHALAAHSLNILPGGAIEIVHYSREEGIEVMPRLLDLGVDAIFCAAGDMCATGLLSGARTGKARIPEDVAIVGYDDALIAKMSNPKLTTIRQPLEQITETVCRIVMYERTDLVSKPQKVLFAPELVVRQSS